MRLINADLLKKNIEKWLHRENTDESETVEIEDISISVMMEIEEQPTAYDVDKVLEQLEECSFWSEPTLDCDGDSYDDEIEIVSLLDAIEIVKKGGME